MSSKRNERGVSTGKRTKEMDSKKEKDEKKVSIGGMGDVGQAELEKPTLPQSNEEVKDGKEEDERGTCWLEQEVTVPSSVLNITKRWLNLLIDAFEREDTKEPYEDFQAVLFKCLDEADLPYLTILHLIASCPNYDAAVVPKHEGITLWLIDGFHEYLTSVTITESTQMSSNDVKTAAFFVAFRQKDVRVIDTIFDLFKLEINSEIYVPLIKKEIEAERYNVAFEAVTRFKLQSHFTSEEILPVLLRDDFETIDAYVEGDVELQRELVRYLDTFCVYRPVAEPLIEALNIPNDLKQRMKYRLLSRVLKVFVKKYDVPRECCPRLKFMQKNDALFSVLYKKYVKSDIDDKEFDTFVKKFIGRSKTFQKKLVFGMARYKDEIGAAYFATKFNVSLENGGQNGTESGTLKTDQRSSVQGGPRSDQRERDERNATRTEQRERGGSKTGQEGERGGPKPQRSGQGGDRKGQERERGPIQRERNGPIEPETDQRERDGSETDQRGQETVQRPREAVGKASATGREAPRKERRPKKNRGTLSPWLEHNAEVPSSVIDITKEWFHLLEDSFHSDTSYAEFCDVLNNCLAKTDSIWWTILHLIASSPDYVRAATKRDSITSFLARGFRDYLERAGTESNPLSNEVRKAAFLVAFHQKQETVFEIIFDTFHLYDNSEMYLPSIKQEIKMKYYEIAARAVAALKLHSHFRPEDILFPLYLEKDYHSVYVYVEDDKTQQQQLVRFLDQFYVGESQFNMLAKKYNLSEQQKKSLSSDAIYRAVKRYAQKFKVSKEHWPNVKRIHDDETLNFILSKKYKQALISDDDFDDYVAETVGDSTELQEKLVCRMAKYGDLDGAAYFAFKYKVPTDRVPNEVKLVLGTGDCERKPSECSSQLHDLIPSGLPRYAPRDMSIRMMLKPQDFEREMEGIRKFQKGAVVAIDCEWKPNFNYEPERLALLQVATKDYVCIFDIHTMRPNLTDKHWSSFRDLLANESILKLGYNFNKDFLILADTSSILNDVSQVTTNLLDMKTVCNNILKAHPEMFPFYDDVVPKIRSLELFVQLCLGGTLDKIHQMSNWERRPLNPDQMIYAGIDAYCLVDMYRVLQTNAQRLGIDLMSFKSESFTKKH